MNQKIAQQIIEDLLKKLSVDFERVEFEKDPVYPMYRITTKDAGVLIGTDGEHLKALNYLLKKIVEKKEGSRDTHFILDVNGYQRKKIKSIQQQANLLAERARTFKADVEMSPMNSYERMIVHSIFADDPGIETESAGMGKFRHIVFKCRRPDEVRVIENF